MRVYNGIHTQQNYTSLQGLDKNRKDGWKTIEDHNLSANYLNTQLTNGVIGINFSIHQMHTLLNNIQKNPHDYLANATYSHLIAFALAKNETSIEFRHHRRTSAYFHLLSLEFAIKGKAPLGSKLCFLNNTLNSHPHMGRLNIAGVEYDTDELLTIQQLMQNKTKNQFFENIETDNVIKNNAVAYNNLLKSHYSTQSVHNSLILRLSDNDLKMMQSLSKTKININKDAVSRDLQNIFNQNYLDFTTQRPVNFHQLLNTFNNLFQHTKDLGEVHERPGYTIATTLKTVLNYVYNQDANLQSNLLLSLLHRLKEITLDDPCTIGMLQRILNVAEGVDSRINSFERQDQFVKDEIGTLAANMRQETESLFEKSIHKHEAISDEIAELMQFNLFKEKVEGLYINLLELNPIRIRDVINHMKYGFFIMSTPPDTI